MQHTEFYVQNYTNVKFKNQVWLPGIDTLTMKPDGSVRAYGTWTGTSKSTGAVVGNPVHAWFKWDGDKVSEVTYIFDSAEYVANMSQME